MASRPTVYLAGPIQHAEDNGHGWRDYVIDRVHAFEWVNPLDHAEPTDVEYEAGEYDIADLVETDKRLIDESDAVLVGWRRVPSVGTPMEIHYAYQHGIPLVVWFEPDGSTETLDERVLSPWLRYHADHIDVALGPCIDALEALIDEDVYYATRKRGRSKGVLHTDRECVHIADIPDEDIIDRPRWAFDPDQALCKACGGED